jgi:hypothetical protein
MKKIIVITLISGLGLLLLSLVFIVPARAEKPVFEKTVWEADFDDYSCTVPISTHIKVNSQRFFWFDKDGNPRGDSWTGSSHGYMFHDDRIVRMHASEEGKITYVSFIDGIWKDVMETSGTQWMASVPGHGVVIGVTGKQVIEETCYFDTDQGIWVCDTVILQRSGMTWQEPEIVCDYLLNGE